MAKSQKLETIISINAKAGNGFGKVGQTLTELGSLINGTSQAVIQFGKESVEVYRGYEKSMKDAEVALSTTYGRGTRELSNVMKELDASATEWAASTIFHTDDVGEAISEAAHAGWDYDQIMSGIPAAMQLAQAGSLDLSEAVNYIVKSTTAAGIGFEDLTDFVDLWTYAANSSASDIGEFGEAMLRMGSTMRFTDSTEELMTLLAVTANAGSVGSEAGTMIRNSIIRLVAPTDKATEAMEALGATSEELADVFDDDALVQANARLAEFGFTAYDGNGQLKPVLDTYRDLYLALGELSGGFEDIEKNQDALQVLSAIFPTRTITEALTLLRAASEGYDGLYESMMNGDAAGYGQYASDTMMDTLNGKILTFESKVERLKQITGGALADDVETVLGHIGSFVDGIAGMDERSFGAFVGGLEGVAAVGPGLLLAGTALRLIGTGGLVALAVTGAAAIGRAVKELQEYDFRSLFGDVDIDREGISGYIDSLTSGFDSAYEKTRLFREELDGAIESYKNASSTFSSDLLNAMLTHKDLSPEDETSLSNLGETMYNSVIAGINAQAAETESFWIAFFGGEGVAQEDELFQKIHLSQTTGYAELMAEAESIGEGLRKAISSAFADNNISEDERTNILEYVRQMNAIMAEAELEVQKENDWVKQQGRLRQAQGASYESVAAMAEEIKAENDAAEQWYYDEFMHQVYRTGLEGPEYEQALEKYNEQVADRRAQTSGSILELYGAMMSDSALATPYNYAMQLAEGVMNGSLSPEAAHSLYGSAGYGRLELLDTFSGIFNALGGPESVSEQLDALQAAGNTEGFDNLYRMVMAAGIAENFSAFGNVDMGIFSPLFGDHMVMNAGVGNWAAPNYKDYYDDVYGKREQSAYTTDMAREALSLIGTASTESYSQLLSAVANRDSMAFESAISSADMVSVISGMQSVVQGLSSTYNLGAYGAAMGYDTTFGPFSDIASAISLAFAPEEFTSQFAKEPVEVPVQANTEEAEASMDALNGEQAKMYITADTSAAIDAINNAASYASRIAARINLPTQGYAEGGRATQASIFGEAGPEWAIPEEHSARTAELLNKAAKASGFTWSELIGMNGGLNSGSGGGATVVYSPTIHASNADGIERVLRDDKERLLQMLREANMIKEMEVYA